MSEETFDRFIGPSRVITLPDFKLSVVDTGQYSGIKVVISECLPSDIEYAGKHYAKERIRPLMNVLNCHSASIGPQMMFVYNGGLQSICIHGQQNMDTLYTPWIVASAWLVVFHPESHAAKSMRRWLAERMPDVDKMYDLIRSLDGRFSENWWTWPSVTELHVAWRT